jgi:hypothetical protein
MSRPFEYPGRYPTNYGNKKYGPEMAIARAESMALRRAFNVSAPTVDERWDLPTVQADVDAVSTPQQPPRTLAERVAERRPKMDNAEFQQRVGKVRDDVAAIIVDAEAALDEDDEVTQSMGTARLAESAAPPTIDDIEACGDEDPSPMALGICDELPGHKGPHRSEHGTWPAAK